MQLYVALVRLIPGFLGREEEFKRNLPRRIRSQAMELAALVEFRKQSGHVLLVFGVDVGSLSKPLLQDRYMRDACDLDRAKSHLLTALQFSRRHDGLWSRHG